MINLKSYKRLQQKNTLILQILGLEKLPYCKRTFMFWILLLTIKEMKFEIQQHYVFGSLNIMFKFICLQFSWNSTTNLKSLDIY